MRLDKYLKVSRIIKRRAVAKDLADDQRVFVNGKLAKPAADIKVGDRIEIRFEHRHILIEVLLLADRIMKDNPSLYELISDKRVDKQEV